MVESPFLSLGGSECGRQRHGQAGRVGAERIVAEHVAVDGPGAGARAAADVAKLAAAAPALQVLGIAQRDEQIAAAVDGVERAVAKIAGAEREKLTGADVAGVRDEDESARAVERGVHQVAAVTIFISGEVSPRVSIFQPRIEIALHAVTAVVRRLDDADSERFLSTNC